MRDYHRIEADIYIDNIRANLEALKACVAEDMKLMAVIKADAYGHGAVCLSKALDDIACYYALAGVDEAVELRAAGCKKPLLILGYSDTSEFDDLIKYDIIPEMCDVSLCRTLSDMAVSAGKKAKIHITVDTGMSRIGFTCDKAGIDAVKEISLMEGIELDGIFTHYAKADEYDKTSARGQLEKFKWFIGELEKQGINIPVRHIANSAGIMEMDNTGFNMVRAGIAMYGLYPSEEVNRDAVKLTPAMELISRVVHVKEVKAGTGIGYGWTFTAPRDMKIATISAGYADGYPRSQSNIGKVIINGEYAPITGRVCMDQFMVDVTHIPDVKTGDKVILIGRSGDKEITVEEVAAPANSFNYELVCNVGRRVPRVYIKNGIKVSEVNYLRKI